MIRKKAQVELFCDSCAPYYAWLPSLFWLCLLIGQPQNKSVVESNNLLGLHRLLDPTSHCTNSGSDLLDPATYMHLLSSSTRGGARPLQQECQMHVGCWSQQFAAIKERIRFKNFCFALRLRTFVQKFLTWGQNKSSFSAYVPCAVTCWIQQPVYFK